MYSDPRSDIVDTMLRQRARILGPARESWGGPKMRAFGGGGGANERALAKPGEDLFVGSYNQSYRANAAQARAAGKTTSDHTPHHSVQDAVSPLTHSRGVTINMRKDLHALTRTFRNPNVPELSLRSHLARDVQDIKGILRGAGYDSGTVRTQLRELIRQNKAAWEGAGKL